MNTAKWMTPYGEVTLSGPKDALLWAEERSRLLSGPAQPYIPKHRHGVPCEDCDPKYGCTMNCGPSAAMEYPIPPQKPYLKR